MEFVILGFLMIRNLTQYDLKNALQQKVSPFFSASLGSIQAALKKLEINGHVEFNEVVENGRRKKVYAINDQGRQYFLDWMLSSIAPNQLEQDAATRLFFLGLMSSSERLAVNQEIIKQLESTVQDFEAASIESQQKAVPQQFEDVVKYQLKTLDLGLFYHKCMLEWFRNFLTEMEANLDG